MIETIDDERKPITYECPMCHEDKKAIYSYATGGRVTLPGNMYITGMCFECLQYENPFYAQQLRTAESEARSYKTQQSKKGRGW